LNDYLYFSLILNSSIGESFKTLFQLLTFDQWNDMVKEISTIANPIVTTAYIIIWTCLGAFIFRNVFVGVMGTNIYINMKFNIYNIIIII